MTENLSSKKRGRPKLDNPRSVADRARDTREKHHSKFLLSDDQDDLKKQAGEMSTSNLISILPKLMAIKWQLKVEIVCHELIKRAEK